MAQTGGMIALIPSPDDAARLTVDGEGAEPVDELHLTIAYLGEDVTGWDTGQREAVLAAVRDTAAATAPVAGDVMSHSMFNPNGDHDRDPCAVYLVVGDRLPAVRDALAEHDVSDHPMWLPHVTAGYGLPVDALSYTGPVTFARSRAALAGERTDIALTGPPVDPPTGPDPDDAEVKRTVTATTNEGGDLAVEYWRARDVDVKAVVRTDAGAERYQVPIGTEIGKARNAQAADAQNNERARDQYETLVSASPRDYRAMLDDLSLADLKALAAITYSFRSSNPTVVQARLAVAGALKRQGLDVNDYGGLGKSAGGGRAGGGRKRTGKTATPKRTKLNRGDRREINASVRGDSVDANAISDGERDRLLQAGWKGRPGDGAERLYRPGSKSVEDDVDPEVKRTTTKPWESRKAQRGGKTIGADKSNEKGGGDEYPVKTIGDIAAGVKRAKRIKDVERRKEVLAHLRAGAKKIGGPAVNMVPKDDAGDSGGKGKGGFVPFKKGGKKDAWSDILTSDDAALLAAIEAKVMSPHPGAVKLREYWARGAGMAKWRPGTPGDFTRLRNQLRKYVPSHMLNGLTANIHKLATGEWPGQGRSHGKTGEPVGVEVKGAGMVELSKADLSAFDGLDDDDSVDLALERYADMDAEITSEDAYEQALADEVDWELEMDGTVSRADGADDEPEPEPEAEMEPAAERALDDGLDALDELFAGTW